MMIILNVIPNREAVDSRDGTFRGGGRQLSEHLAVASSIEPQRLHSCHTPPFATHRRLIDSHSSLSHSIRGGAETPTAPNSDGADVSRH